jgi:hypothetical protein
VSTADVFELEILFNGYVGGAELSEECVVTADAKCGMGFASGTEVGFDSEVKGDVCGGKPCTAAKAERVWFGEFGHAEEIAIEGTCAVFAADGHSELDMIDGHDRERRHDGHPIRESKCPQMLKSSISPIRYAQL